MRKIFSILAIVLFTSSLLQSCREEKTVEVETLAPDVEDDSDDEGFDTNPVSGDQ